MPLRMFSPFLPPAAMFKGVKSEFNPKIILFNVFGALKRTKWGITHENLFTNKKVGVFAPFTPAAIFTGGKKWVSTKTEMGEIKGCSKGAHRPHLAKNCFPAFFSNLWGSHIRLPYILTFISCICPIGEYPKSLFWTWNTQPKTVITFSLKFLYHKTYESIMIDEYRVFSWFYWIKWWLLA